MHSPKVSNYATCFLQQSSGGVFQKGVIRNFIKFTGSLLFNKVAGLKPATLL